MLLLAADARFAEHQPGPGHPERPARSAAVDRGIAEAGIDDAIVHLDPCSAPLEAIGRVHDRAMLDELAALDRAGGGRIDPDTVAGKDSFAIARLAAGAGLAAQAALRRGEADAAFLAVRPPGHHATAHRSMGFCLLNNVAVVAADLAVSGERVVVVDIDAHHGNGTQDIFWEDPSVAYVSFHEWPLYPGTGRIDDDGGAAAPGTVCNLPLPSGATGDVYLAGFDEVVVPFVEHFGPDWVLLSAGYDAHRDDPLTGLALSAGDYGALVARAVALAPRPGRTIAFLEGGYDLDGLRHSVATSLPALIGAPARPIEPATTGGPGHDVIAAARARRVT